MMRGESDQPLSARVRLEIAFLDDAEIPDPAPSGNDERPRFTALVVAAEPDVRRYIGECLRGRADLRIHEAATTRVATEIARRMRLDFLIVDGSDNLEGLSHLRTIVIVDDIPYGAATATPRLHLLGRPFSAEQLAAAVDRLLQGE
jgi:CheY-like chemotaxis protein